ncbi:hypothetical protein HYDPIDRAFT_107169 [Hydnomerulius pinastri MD-312]|nr:hypothetical protein HYDPIDRAFT_107169 [Hydnomerulius pinastri MD-312]
MRQTRSATRASTTTPAPAAVEATTPTPAKAATKRKAAAPPVSTSKTPRAKKPKSSGAGASTQATVPDATGPVIAPPPPLEDQKEEALVPAVLNFSFEDAKAHLINIDPRFAELFARLKCKPFEYLEQVHPFRSLVVSILGQQISWLAARSINHKFIRLYDPSLPEKPADYDHAKSPIAFFPTPYQVANTEVATLKTAGLSTRKAEYVKDLASRFADGRLSTAKLLAADDEELAEMLIEVRGIGRWTVDMFSLFTLRRSNVLPVGDLGVQRGMVRWFGGAGFGIRPEKEEDNGDAKKEDKTNVNVEGKPKGKGKGKAKVNGKGKGKNSTITTPARAQDADSDAEAGAEAEGGDALPTFTVTGVSETETRPTGSAVPEDISSVPPSSLLQTPHPSASNLAATPSALLPIPSLPKPFTPSINKVIEGNSEGNMKPWTKPLPEGLTSAVLKSRLDGKKVKGAFLTPQEMEVLAQDWVPYRSLAVYYMWALADGR